MAAYIDALKDESAEELKGEIKSSCHYVIEPELTYTNFAEAARNNSFNREQLQKAFNYEYLIGQFASETGKKAGKFYTPQAVSKILTRIAISGQESKKGLSVYDPCMGYDGFQYTLNRTNNKKEDNSCTLKYST